MHDGFVPSINYFIGHVLQDNKIIFLVLLVGTLPGLLVCIMYVTLSAWTICAC